MVIISTCISVNSIQGTHFEQINTRFKRADGAG